MVHRSKFLATLVIFTVVVGVTLVSSPLVATATTNNCQFPYSTSDATGTDITVEEEPQRIVTLSPSAAQTVWEIGGQDKVVGVSKYAAYLEGAETKTNISGAGQAYVNIELVVSLEPDLVLAPNIVGNETIEKLREAGLTVFKYPFQTSIDDIKQKTRRTGRLIGKCDGAEETVAWMESELETVHEATSGVDRPRVLYVFHGYTAGTGTFIHTIIETAGGRNIAAEVNISGYKPISQEIVVDTDPEWIVVNDGATQVPKTTVYNNTYAVRHDQIVVLKEEYISQPAPRIVLSVIKLTKALHPDAYDAAARETPTETTTVPQPTRATPTATTPSPITTTTTTETTPGFGHGIALAAIAVTVLLYRRAGRTR